MAEKYCLTWSDFNLHVVKGLNELRNENYFCDVTLVSDEDHEFQAHKVILSTCSDYFKNLLRNKKDSHPLVCIDGLSCQELKNVITYIYSGEVIMESHHLERFMLMNYLL